MKLMVSAYNGVDDWETEAEETALRSYSISHSFNEPARCNIVLGDPTGAILRKYQPPPLIICILDDGGVMTDQTVEALSATDDDMTLILDPSAVNDAYYFGFATNTVASMTLDLSTTGAWAGANTWEYWDGDSWEALTKIDGGNSKWLFEVVNGPTVYAWTPASDWAGCEVNGIDAYYIRSRVSSLTGVTTAPLGGYVRASPNTGFIGTGKITLEDPTATDVFYGRILRAVGNSAERTVTLECVDWLDQLDEQIITYDLREKLSGDVRQSYAHADPTAAFVGPAENSAGTFYFYDANMAWGVNTHAGKNLILTGEMAGSITVNTGTYQDSVCSATVGAGDAQNIGCANTWEDGAGWSHESCVDNDESWTHDFEFKPLVGHNTPSDLYVHDSISAARIHITYMFSDDSGLDSLCDLQIYDLTSAGFVGVGTIDPHLLPSGSTRKRVTITLSDKYAAACVDASGIMKVRFNVTRGAGTTFLYIYYIHVEVDVETIGYSSPITISANTATKLTVGTDLTAAATKIWEGTQYCITRKIYEHIEDATGPILGGDTIVTLTCGAANVENTTGVSTRQYKNRTRLQIATDLAIQDGAVLWVALGGTTVTYKKTFGAATATLTDADVDIWQSLYDYNTMTNDLLVYGMRIGDYEIYQNVQNATSITRYKATRSQVHTNMGLVSDADALAIGTTLAARDSDIKQMLGTTISGFDTTHRLGTIVEITSSYLWPTAARDYLVTRWAYDSKMHKSYLTLHPKVSIGLQPILTVTVKSAILESQAREAQKDKYVPAPISNEVI